MKHSTKNALTVSTLLSAALAMTGCDKDIKEVAAAAAKELGVPVSVKTDSDDVCAQRQLERMIKQYQDLGKDDKRFARRLLKGYKGIVVNPTAKVAKYTGDSTVLYVGKEYKYLADKRKLEGPAPKTGLDKAESLSLSTQGAVDESKKRVYSVREDDVFKMIDSETSPVLQKALNTGAGKDLGYSYGAIMDCGELANLHDLF
ncbi:MAG: hypothetical protein HY075_15285 [Deltaproteobacteria bacterium]|nr:hypothetical protein [Deltaproteobacteria bacterium]